MGYADLSAVFLIGFFGSAHCIGMCGGFAVMAHGGNRAHGGITAHGGNTARGGNRAPGGQGFQRMLGYAAGKTLTYAVLGALAGSVGHIVLRATGAQTTVTILVGLLLILLGLGAAGVIPDRLPFIGTARLGAAMGKAMREAGPLGPVGLGVLNGLMPCGLVYAVLAKAAATGTATAGMVQMVVFGMATVPALWIFAALGNRLVPRIRGRMVRLGGILVILLGLITLWRAIAPHVMQGMHTMN